MNYQDFYQQWTQNFQYGTRQSLVRYSNFSLIVSELVQVTWGKSQ